MRRRIATLAARPDFWLGLLLTWTLLSALRSWHTPWARAAGTEALHWGAGLLLALTLGRGLRRTTEAAQALTALLGVLAAAVVFEGPHADGLLVGPYGDHQLCASALLALLPVSLALALAAPAPAWRWGAQITAVAAALCLALTQTRSAWVGAAAAALVFFALWQRRPVCTPRRARRRAWVVPALLAVGVAGAGAVLIAGTDLSPSLAARALTLQSLRSVSRDADWRARTQAWRGAAAMAAARPALGWGLGRYPGAQWAWTRTGRPLAPTERPSLSEQAHDFYLQTLVETGAVGLALYLAALIALATRCLQALRAHGPRPDGLRGALLVATLSLLAGQGVDAVASPAWQFPAVSLLFWACLGLGLAATRHRQTAEAHSPLPRPARRALRLVAGGAAGVTVVAQFLPLGLLLPAMAVYSPPSAGDMYVQGSAYLTGPTAAAAGSTVDYRIMAYYSRDGTAKNEYLVNVTGDSDSTFKGSPDGVTLVGTVVIDRANQVIHYTLPASLASGHTITLYSSFKYSASQSKANTPNFTLTMQ